MAVRRNPSLVLGCNGSLMRFGVGHVFPGATLPFGEYYFSWEDWIGMRLLTNGRHGEGWAGYSG